MAVSLNKLRYLGLSNPVQEKKKEKKKEKKVRKRSFFEMTKLAL